MTAWTFAAAFAVVVAALAIHRARQHRRHTEVEEARVIDGVVILREAPHIARSPLADPFPTWNGPTRRLPIVANYGRQRTATTSEVRLIRSTNYDEARQWPVLTGVAA